MSGVGDRKSTCDVDPNNFPAATALEGSNTGYIGFMKTKCRQWAKSRSILTLARYAIPFCGIIFLYFLGPVLIGLSWYHSGFSVSLLERTYYVLGICVLLTPLVCWRKCRCKQFLTPFMTRGRDYGKSCLSQTIKLAMSTTWAFIVIVTLLVGCAYAVRVSAGEVGWQTVWTCLTTVPPRVSDWLPLLDPIINDFQSRTWYSIAACQINNEKATYDSMLDLVQRWT